MRLSPATIENRPFVKQIQESLDEIYLWLISKLPKLEISSKATWRGIVLDEESEFQ